MSEFAVRACLWTSEKRPMVNRGLMPFVHLLAAALLCGSFLAPATAADEYYTQVTIGMDGIERGAYAAAVDAFIKAQRADRDDPLAHLGLAVVAIYLGDTTAAMSEFRSALRLSPQSSLAYNGLGLCYLLSHHTNDAVVHLANAVRQDPTYADAYVNLAYAYCQEKQGDNALEQCRIAQKAGAEGLFFYEVQASAHSLLGAHDNAIIALRKVVQQQSNRDSAPRLVLLDGGPVSVVSLARASSGMSGSSAILDRLNGMQLSNSSVPVFTASTPASLSGEGLASGKTWAAIAAQTGGHEVNGVMRVMASLHSNSGSETSAREIRYVSFAVDGHTRAVTNDPPFAWMWDTRNIPDGEHVVSIRAYGKAGDLVGEQRLPVRVLNSPADNSGPSQSHYTEAQEKTSLIRMKKALRMQPDPVHSHYLLGKSYEAKGLLDFALAEYTTVFLANREYADTRDQLLLLRRRLGRTYPNGRVPEVDSVEGGSRKIAVTFDDGPRFPFTEKILQLLKASDARCTFFVVGKMAELHPELLRMMAASGHELASHSYTHRFMSELTVPEIEEELLRTETAIREITDKRIQYFRPPGGHYNARVREALANLGYQSIFWGPNITSFTDLAPAQTAEELLKLIQPGCIVLLHNGEDDTVPVLPRLLAGIKAKGYQMVTVSELLREGRPVYRKFNWE